MQAESYILLFRAWARGMIKKPFQLKHHRGCLVNGERQHGFTRRTSRDPSPPRHRCMSMVGGCLIFLWSANSGVRTLSPRSRRRSRQSINHPLLLAWLSTHSPQRSRNADPHLSSSLPQVLVPQIHGSVVGYNGRKTPSSSRICPFYDFK